MSLIEIIHYDINKCLETYPCKHDVICRFEDNGQTYVGKRFFTYDDFVDAYKAKLIDKLPFETIRKHYQYLINQRETHGQLVRLIMKTLSIIEPTPTFPIAEWTLLDLGETIINISSNPLKHSDLFKSNKKYEEWRYKVINHLNKLNERIDDVIVQINHDNYVEVVVFVKYYLFH
jgi:hypothetical protein